MLNQDQICIVTGGGKGIGQGIAKVLAAEGATVVVAGRSEDLLGQTAEAEKGPGTVVLPSCRAHLRLVEPGYAATTARRSTCRRSAPWVCRSNGNKPATIGIAAGTR